MNTQAGGLRGMRAIVRLAGQSQEGRWACERAGWQLGCLVEVGWSVGIAEG